MLVIQRISFAILLFSLYNRAEAQCDGSTLTVEAGPDVQTISSPNYPSDYPVNSSCAWVITANGSLSINVQAVSLECDYDFLNITDGIDNTSDPLYSICTDIVGVVTSDDGNFYITFTSDFSNQESGFQIQYFQADANYQPACGSVLTATTTAQTMQSPNLPNNYATDIDCSWTISVSGTNTIVVKVVFLDMKDIFSCSYGALRLYDGVATNGTLLKKLCSNNADHSLVEETSTGANMFLTFQTERLSASDIYYGFILTYEQYVATTTTTTPASTTPGPQTNSVCSSSGVDLDTDFWVNYVTSPNFGTSNYENYLTCRWTITAPTNYSVEISFGDTFEIENHRYCSYDSLSIYDGNSTSSPLINTLCGYTSLTNIYRSSDRQMLVVFRTDYSVVYPGFQIAYIAVDNTYPGCASGYTTYDVTYNRAAGWSGTFSTISNTGYGSGSYSSNMDEYWLFQNPNTATYKMVLEFTFLDVERSSGCVYDRVIIYNGPCLKDGVHDTSCGSWKKRYDLTGSEYLVHFHTDNSFNSAGFEMEYYAIPLPTTPPPTTTTTTIGPPIAAVIDVMNDALANYSVGNFPVRNLSNAVDSTVDFYLVGINGIDEVEQKMVSTGQFVVKWSDGNIGWSPRRVSNVQRLLIPQDDMWRPDLVLMNGVTQLQQMGASFMFIDVDYNGTCVWKPFQILESVCKVDMTYYPYDTQTCSLQFGTWSSTDSQVTTTLGDSGLAIHPDFQDNSEWTLLSTSSETVTVNSQRVIKFYFTVKRNPTYIVFYMTIPTVMLAYLNVFTFVLPCDSGEKSGFGITIFLSLVVILVVTKGSMPDNSDTISMYVLYLLTMIFFSTVTMMIATYQLRMKEFRKVQHKIGGCLVGVVTLTTIVQKKIFRIGLQPSQQSEDTAVDEVLDDDTIEVEPDDPGVEWPDVVNSLDFLYSMIFFLLTTIATLYFLLSLSFSG